MKMANHYIRLREHLSLPEGVQEAIVTLDELAAILDCTHRNVVLILKRLADKQWLIWSPKRGRGNKSTLTFLVKSEELVLQIARNFVEKKDLRSAMDYINRPSLPQLSREHFNEWLFSYFGYRAELKDHKKIDLLRFPLSQAFYTLDPAFINYSSESHLVNQIFDSLVRYNPQNQMIEAHIAHAWEIDTSRTVWTFFLRKGVLFHNGKELHAEDVRFTLNRLRHVNPRSLYRWAHLYIRQINVLDANTLQIVLNEPNELFAHFLSTNRAAIIPIDYGGETKERFAKAPIGTGPFKLVKNDGSICVLEAFQPYFQGRAHLDQLEIWNIPDLYEHKQSKSFEGFQILHNFRLPDHAEETSWNQVHRGEICKFITLNLLKEGPLKEVETRRIVTEMIRQHLHLDTAKEGISPTDGFLDKELSELNTEELFANESASLTDTLVLCTIPQYEADAIMLQKVCQLAGIKLQIKLLPLAQFQGEQRLEADFILFAVMLDNDKELRLIDLYKSMQQHVGQAVKLQMEFYLETIIHEIDPLIRTKQFIALERMLKDIHAIHFLYRKQLKTVYHPSVKGISMDSLGWMEFKNIWFRSSETPTAYFPQS
ncbi:ABC transporter substrate-binding protein [Paenibacillus psychroresistens]|uniref:ABC transporter substrate-binding protein n=1 Tax=Paenibacillus psychroresistens TaxID=1778678 RepID=A0A6B8RIA9_9BACL|nr:ABC transporter substrate-binding protein [Paenibacillus psychroresistens]QGQ95335.1 ABC transporter substrate-binding protein [Paenibacillus psychroresistens]